MGANVKLAEAMSETAKTMGQMNKVMDPQKLAGTMREFEMANAKMAMTEETSKDSFWIVWNTSYDSYLYVMSVFTNLLRFFIREHYLMIKRNIVVRKFVNTTQGVFLQDNEGFIFEIAIDYRVRH